MGSNPPGKVPKPCGILSEREDNVPSPYCALNIGEFQSWISDFPDVDRGEGCGPYALLSATLLGDVLSVM